MDVHCLVCGGAFEKSEYGFVCRGECSMEIDDRTYQLLERDEIELQRQGAVESSLEARQ